MPLLLGEPHAPGQLGGGPGCFLPGSWICTPSLALGLGHAAPSSLSIPFPAYSGRAVPPLACAVLFAILVPPVCLSSELTLAPPLPPPTLQEPWLLSLSSQCDPSQATVRSDSFLSRPQDYGPKVNFRKQKLKTAGFRGLPSFSREVVRRMGLYPGLEGFQPVEQCNLDYSPERGSAIDPHLDDAWLWGERLVSLNLLSPTVVSMCREASGSLLLRSAPSAGAEAFGDSVIAPSRSVLCQEVEVAIPVPRRSLLVLAGAARHQWTHAIHRRHIEARRVCATFRELSAEFRPGGRQQDLGHELLQIALSFQGRPV